MKKLLLSLGAIAITLTLLAGGIFAYRYLTFTGTEQAEEEITDDTVFETLVIVRNDDEVHISRNDSMSMYDKDQTKEFHALIDGKLELVWEVDRDEL